MRRIVWPSLFVMFALMPGCATTEFVRLREKPSNPLAERLKTGSHSRIGASARTTRFFRRTGFRADRDLPEMLNHASQYLSGPLAKEAMHAAAELNYLGAEHQRFRDVQLASEMYLDSAQMAWRYFSTPGASGAGTLPDPNDSQHRSTAEVYNASCEALLRIARKYGQYQLGRSLTMPLTDRQLRFSIPFESSTLKTQNLAEFEFVADYELKNLRSRHTSPGLGVPIIAVRKAPAEADPMEEYYTRGMSFPATLLLRFSDSAADVDGQNATVRMELYDPRESEGVIVDGTLLPLETDLSTPLARFLSNDDLGLLDTWGFLRPDHAGSVEGLYMVQPYDPDRIPVLMVHGLWSSPMTWMEMFNDLQADPELRKRYQFWFYLYPTGEPLAFSAANLRDELQQVRDDCDPYRQNEKLDEMVMVGHSMGGLISYLMTIDSEDRLWNSVSRVPVADVLADEEQRNEIHRVFFFQSLPSVRRIVTIASPYGGSNLSNRFTRWLSSRVIWLPGKTHALTELLFEHNKMSWWDRVFAPRTSIDSLTKESAVLKLISSVNVPPDITLHNIVGVRKGTSPSDWTDGIVTWESAHKETAVSEKLVHAGHSEVQRHPDTIEEVRRILKEHLRSVGRRRFPVIPVHHEVPYRADEFPQRRLPAQSGQQHRPQY